MDADEEICDLCDGTGEIDSSTIQDVGSVPCPTCVSVELHARIAELKAALRGVIDWYRQPSVSKSIVIKGLDEVSDEAIDRARAVTERVWAAADAAIKAT